MGSAKSKSSALQDLKMLEKISNKPSSQQEIIEQAEPIEFFILQPLPVEIVNYILLFVVSTPREAARLSRITKAWSNSLTV